MTKRGTCYSVQTYLRTSRQYGAGASNLDDEGVRSLLDVHRYELRAVSLLLVFHGEAKEANGEDANKVVCVVDVRPIC